MDSISAAPVSSWNGTENQSPILGIIAINPNLDSVVESKIASQNYDAEFGYAGAGIALALLSAAMPIESEWDRVLLISNAVKG